MAVNITTEKYDPMKVELIKKNLETQTEQGAPLFYEIYVDNLKVVQRTNKVELFDNFEEFVNEDTLKIRILIYSTHPTAPRNTKHIFLLKENGEEKRNELHGLEMQKIVSDQVSRERERWDCDQVKKDLATANAKLAEAEEYAETLQKIIDETKKKLQEADGMGEITSIIKTLAIPYFVGKNPAEKGNLSGSEEKKPEAEASFKMKSSEEGDLLSEDEKNLIAFGKSLQTNFTKEELEMLFSIIDEFVKDKTSIKPVQELLNINPNPQKTKTPNEKV